MSAHLAIAFQDNEERQKIIPTKEFLKERDFTPSSIGSSDKVIFDQETKTYCSIIRS